MVRAKVTSIRLAQESGEEEKAKTLAEHHSYIQLALGYTRPRKPMLLITHGLSGSGKSVISAQLADAGGFIHIRSDVERKRLFGIDSLDRSAGKGLDIYTAETTRKTYAAMLDATSTALSAGFPVIVDATFPDAHKRAPFLRLARTLEYPCHILCFHAPREVLRERVRARHEAASDASEADLNVLEAQLHAIAPPDGDEKALCIKIDTEGEINIEALLKALEQ